MITRQKRFQIYLLYCIGFVDLLAIGITVPLIVQHLKSLDASHSLIGLMGAAHSGFQMFSGPLIGSLSDLRGRKEILIFTILCGSTAYLLLGILTPVFMLVSLRVLLGLFKQTQTLTEAMAADISSGDAEQSGIFGKMTAISGLGITLGPIVGGHISEDLQPHGFTIACAVASLLLMSNAGLAYFIEKNAIHDKEQKSLHGKKHAVSLTYLYNSCVDSLKMSLKYLLTVDWYRYWDIFLFKMIVDFSVGCYFSTFTIFLKSRYGLSPKWIGYTISFQEVITSLCSFFIQRISDFYKVDKDYSQRNLHGFVIMVLSYTGMLIAPNYIIFVVSLIPLSVCKAVMRQTSFEMIIDKSLSKHRGSVIGASNSMKSLAGITAPLVAGYLSDLINVSSTLYASILSCLLGVVIAAFIRFKSFHRKITSKKRK